MATATKSVFKQDKKWFFGIQGGEAQEFPSKDAAMAAEAAEQQNEAKVQPEPQNAATSTPAAQVAPTQQVPATEETDPEILAILGNEDLSEAGKNKAIAKLKEERAAVAERFKEQFAAIDANDDLSASGKAKAKAALVAKANEPEPAQEIGGKPMIRALEGHEHEELGVRTAKFSAPWLIDEVLLANVGHPLSAVEIAAKTKEVDPEGNGVGLKKVKIHLTYWLGTENIIGENNWSAKRAKTGLCTRMRRSIAADGKTDVYCLAPKQ